LITGPWPRSAQADDADRAFAAFAAGWRRAKTDLGPTRRNLLADLALALEAAMPAPSFRNTIQPMLLEVRAHMDGLDADTIDAWSAMHRLNSRGEPVSVSVLVSRIEARAKALIAMETYWYGVSPAPGLVPEVVEPVEDVAEIIEPAPAPVIALDHVSAILGERDRILGIASEMGAAYRVLFSEGGHYCEALAGLRRRVLA